MKQSNIINKLHRYIYNNIRDSIMKYGDKSMENPGDTLFLFGKPSKLINDFLFCLYNENIIRISNSPKEKFPLMISVVERVNEPKTIYITISEEPKNDKYFYFKVGTLLRLVHYIIGDNNVLTSISKTNNYSNNTGNIQVLDCSKQNIQNIINNDYYQKDYKLNKINFTKHYINNDIDLSNIKVKFVFNNTYIKNRQKGYSFEPFYKPDKIHKEFIACNSGSICSESKIFSYFNNDIIGTVTYWLGNGFPKKCISKKLHKCNYHPQYCYGYTKNDLQKIDKIYDILNKSDKISDKLFSIIKKNNKYNIFRPYSLPCPGCTLNANNYINKIFVKWEKTIKNCL